jgi:asparagine synthase (glutamine-hydrolysing)
VCGFAGYIGRRALPDQELLEKMGNAIIHRGPDDSGIWFDRDTGVGLSHRRLAILDLSSAGHQPMTSASARYVIAFNGEIYNHLILRNALDVANIAPAWCGHSDTETLLAGFNAWGVEATLKKAVGMFAIALWDRKERTLALVRDRVGEKPLYFGWNNGTFLFGSELKALRAFPDFEGEISRNAITLLLRYNYIPAPYSIYRGIFKLPPGTMLRLRQGGRGVCPWNIDTPPFASFHDGNVSLHPYWSLRDIAEGGQSHLFAGTDEDAVCELERVLSDAVVSQQISDVPLGALLSGGVDSSTIVALMQSRSGKRIRTFTIGFGEDDYNEAVHAKAVAKHLGTEHTELYITPDETLKVIPRLPALYDEPFSDSSQIPTFLVAQMARQHVTVSLSGDAGDELFGGYNRYFLTNSIWSKIRWLPRIGRRVLARGITAISPERWDHLYGLVASANTGRMRAKRVGDKAHKLAEILPAATREAIYYGLVSHWKAPANLVLEGHEPLTVLTNSTSMALLTEFEHRMMYLDTISYLPDDILVKVDRAAMGVSLETRVPFLDHRVVEFAWRLPLAMKIRNGQGKWIIRQILSKYVPRELIERPKMGFGIPIDSWLRGPLRGWVEDLLNESRLRREGYFNPSPIRQKWVEHLSGKRNWQYHLWDVLMFQAWLQNERR